MILTAEFESFLGFISSEDTTPDMLKNKLNTFLESVKRQIDSFFLYSNKGNQIKSLFDVDETKTVSTLDFSYGMEQYMEYFAGMQKYIEEAKEKSMGDVDLTEKVKEIMEKDTSFIKSLFVRGENVHNKEITIPACQAVYCTNALLELKSCIDISFSKVTFNGNILDQLIAQSIASMAYYVMNGAMDEVDQISTQVDASGSNQTPVIEFKVF